MAICLFFRFRFSSNLFNKPIIDSQTTKSRLNEVAKQTPLVFITDGKILKEVKIIKASDEAITLPEKLFIKSGLYRIIDDHAIFLSGQSDKGFYLLQIQYLDNSGKVSCKRRIILLDNYTEKSILSALKMIHRHGSQDDGKDKNLLIEIAKRRDLSLTCGYISELAQKILSSFKIKSRKFLMIKEKHNDRNNMDDGHTMLEVKTRSGWQLYDMSLGNNFFKENNMKPLNAHEAFSEIKSNTVILKNFIDDNYHFCNYDKNFPMMLKVFLDPIAWLKQFGALFVHDENIWRTTKEYAGSFEFGKYEEKYMRIE